MTRIAGQNPEAGNVMPPKIEKTLHPLAVKLAEFWELTPIENEQILGRAFADLERMKYLINIQTSLDSLFRDAANERQWLRAARVDLGGKSPLFLMTHGDLKDLIEVNECLLYLCGV